MSLVSVSTPAGVTADMDMWYKSFTKIPGAYGFDTNGINLAKGLVVTAANFQFNYSQQVPLTWILPAFVAYRGSTHWTFNVNSGANPVEHMRVLTTLTAPVASSSVSILVFVRAGDNLELANPIDLPAYSTWAVQSDVQQVNRVETLGTMQDKRCGEQNLINFGETVKSLRQLLRRMSLVSVSTPAGATADMDLWYKSFTNIPGAYGYDTNGINLAKGLVVTAANFQFNYSQQIPLTWILPAFVAYRGSTHWTFNVNSGANPVEHMRVLRTNVQGGGAYEASAASAYGTTSANAAFFYNATYAGASGQALTNQRTNTGLSVTAPMYTAYRFQSTAPANYTLPGYSDGQGLDLFRLETLFSTSGGAPVPTASKIWAYNSIGTDFGCHFFLNVPTFWIYSAVPTPD